MAIDREKVLQNAQKFVEKKKYDKAVLEYQKIIQEDPNDARTLLKIGDLQSKMEAYAEAIATYERVGKFYATQGFALKAIAVFKQIREIIAKHVPQLEERYAHIAPRLAELYQQLGLVSDALATLDEVATRLQRASREQEAIDVFKKIVELDPTNPLPHLRLAEALSRNKDIDSAIVEFAFAASTLVKLGRRDDALKVLERLLHHRPDPAHARIAAELYLARGQQTDGMLALAKLQICFQANPKDLDTLGLLAKAFNAIGQGPKAIEVQKEMARLARDQGRQDLFKQLLDKLVRLAPNDEVVMQLAGIQAQPEPQAPPPPPPPQQRPPPPPSRDNFNRQNQQSEARGSYRQDDPYARQPPPAPSRSQEAYGRRAPEPEPEAVETYEDDELSYEEIGTGEIENDEQPFPLGHGRNDVPSPDRYGSGGSEVYVDEAAIEVVEEQGEGAPTADVRAQLARILADATSFRRARLYSRAVETLRIGLEIHPRSIEVRECLRDALLEAGRNEEAVEEMLILAGIFVDMLDADAAARALQDVLSVDTTNARAIQMLRELGYDIIEEEEQAPPPPPGEDEYVPAVFGRAPGYDQQSSHQPHYDPDGPLPSYDLDDAAPEPSHEEARYARRGSPSMTPRDLEDIDDPFVQDQPLPSFPLEHPPESEASFDLAVRRPGAHGAPRPASIRPPSMRPGNEGTDTFNAPLPQRAETSTASRRPVAGPELEEALEEAEFFVSRGLYDDARSILLEQLARLPDHPLIVERMAELDAHEQSVQAGSGPRQTPKKDEHPAEHIDRSFDIAATLDAIEGMDLPTNEAAPYMDTEQQVDVEEVFAKFKEGVAKQISVDDAQAHYDLGVAYKEMALLEDAIREFEISARDPKRECVCQSMIGMIQMERGNINEALDAFMRGLRAPGRNAEQETVLSFEIGIAYEAKKLTKEALNFYNKVLRQNPNYRDVQERIRRLAKPEQKPLTHRAAAVGADDEFDRAFDDIIGSGKLP